MFLGIIIIKILLFCLIRYIYDLQMINSTLILLKLFNFKCYLGINKFKKCNSKTGSYSYYYKNRYRYRYGYRNRYDEDLSNKLTLTIT